jgi:hypothetical protein
MDMGKDPSLWTAERKKRQRQPKHGVKLRMQHDENHRQPLRGIDPIKAIRMYGPHANHQ